MGKKILNWVVGLAVIAFGVYLLMDAFATDKRFESGTVKVAQAVPASSEYTETRSKFGLVKSYKTDLGFKTEQGEDVFVRGANISKEELDQLQAGQPIAREYLADEPNKIRAPGEKEPKWLAFVFMVVGLVIGLVGLGGGKDEEETPAFADHA